MTRDTRPWNAGWTSLAALAEATSRIHLGILVSSVAAPRLRDAA